MKQFIIPYEKHLTFSGENTIEIDTYKWSENCYQPKVDIFLCHDNTRLAVKFIAHEPETILRTTETQDGADIYQDSCVEFFLKPYLDDPRYLNIEINPRGTTSMSIRTGRFDKKPIVHMYKPHLNLLSKIDPHCWTTCLELPFETLCEVFENPHSLCSGDTVYGNFYKCGDETAFPHFGIWNEIELDAPDFHQPQFFGKLILGQLD